jgi:hypothetical protein
MRAPAFRKIYYFWHAGSRTSREGGLQKVDPEQLGFFPRRPSVLRSSLGQSIFWPTKKKGGVTSQATVRPKVQG